MAISSIRTIFETNNIYQSIVICQDSHFDMLYIDLVKEGYPLSKLEESARFKNFETRMLALKLSEWNNNHEIITSCVNTVMFIECQPSKADMFMLRNASVFIFSI